MATPCGFVGCTEIGIYTPVLSVSRRKASQDDGWLELQLEIRVCDRHIRAPLRAYVSDDARHYIDRLVRQLGYDVPDAAGFKIHFETALGLIVQHNPDPFVG